MMQKEKQRKFVPPEQLHSDLALFPRWHVLASALPEQVENCEGRAQESEEGRGWEGWVGGKGGRTEAAVC